jgi:hypothetical protein
MVSDSRARFPYRSTLIAALRIISFLLLITTRAQASTTSQNDCEQGPSSPHLYVINEGGVDATALHAAIAEADTIWRTAGLNLTWTFPPAELDTSDPRTVVVIVRRRLSMPAGLNGARAGGRGRSPLGWVVFGEDGRPGRMIEVSLDTVQALIGKGKYMDKPMSQLPSQVLIPMTGRALGRVIAHELGHWLMGRGHTPTGLMRASFNFDDLAEYTPPVLPRAWKDGGVTTRLTAASGCTLSRSEN